MNIKYILIGILIGAMATSFGVAAGLVHGSEIRTSMRRSISNLNAELKVYRLLSQLDDIKTKEFSEKMDQLVRYNEWVLIHKWEDSEQ
jgi:gas vesicle protein